MKNIFSISSPGLWEILTVIKKIPACKVINITSSPSSSTPTVHKSGIGVQQSQHQIQKVINHHDEGTANADANKKVFNQNLAYTGNAVALHAMAFLLKLYGAVALNCLAVLSNDKVVHISRNKFYIHQRTRLE